MSHAGLATSGSEAFVCCKVHSRSWYGDIRFADPPAPGHIGSRGAPMRGEFPGPGAWGSHSIVRVRHGGEDLRPRCPQWWKVFSVHGRTGVPYEVYVKHVVCGVWRCTCQASEFGDRCWHIRCVLRHGCLACPGREPGPNDLGAVNVSITGAVKVPLATRRTPRRCACGEMMLSPKLRMSDDAGHQLVEVQIGGRGAPYAYVSQRELAVGDVVSHYGWSDDGVVVRLGTDYAGELAHLP